jgi:hypothetical protein
MEKLVLLRLVLLRLVESRPAGRLMFRMRALTQERQLNCTPNSTPVGLGEGAHASLPANVNLTGSPQRLRPVADKMPVGPTAEMAVPRPESFSTVRWCT